MSAARAGTVILGGGVCGLSCALSLMRKAAAGRLQSSLFPIMVLEQNSSAGQETTSRNSGVIHGGLYYPTDSLKSSLCLEGRQRLVAFARQYGVPHAVCGKLLVATSDSERQKLRQIQSNAIAAGLTETECRLVSQQDVKAYLEPSVHCTEALLSSVTGWIDTSALVSTIQSLLVDVDLVFNCHVTTVGRDDANASFLLETSLGQVICDNLVNAGGLSAAAIAQSVLPQSALTLKNHHHQYFAKGSYFRLKLGKSKSPPFSHHVYPVPTDGGLGIHATLGADDHVRFGPDVEWLTNPKTGTFDWGLDDYPTGAALFDVDETRVDAFANAIRRYYPALNTHDLSPDYAGIRPKLSGPGEPGADFAIVSHQHASSRRSIHLIGIESPGLTSALAIGEYVASRLPF